MHLKINIHEITSIKNLNFDSHKIHFSLQIIIQNPLNTPFRTDYLRGLFNQKLPLKGKINT